MAAAPVSDVGLEVIREKNIRKERWMWNGGDRNKGEHTRMSWKPCCYLPTSGPPTAMMWVSCGSWRSSRLDNWPTKWGSRSATACVSCHSAKCPALPFWAQREYGCFSPAFQISVKCLLCPTLTWNYARKRILGNVVSSAVKVTQYEYIALS